MNANRKADLQRKLALAPVPKPPAGLAERIKTEIPKELRFDAARERERLSHSVRFSIAVAASVIVVISSAYLALQIMTRVDQTTAPVRALHHPVLTTAAPPSPEARAEKNEEVQQKPVKLAARRQRAKELKKQEPLVAVTSVAEPAAQAGNVMVKSAAPTAPPAAAMMDRAEAIPIREMTTSPISGRAIVRDGNKLYEEVAKTNLRSVPWKDASRETKIEILKFELARGADRQAVIRAAREAGLNEFADSIEKQH